MLLPQKVRPEPAPTRTPLRRTHHEPRRRDEQARAHQAPGDALRLPNPKKDAEPSEQHRERKRKSTEEIARAAKFANRACRAHEHGRCVYTASECSAVHFADLDTIDCNSSIKEGDVRYTNKRFGICHKERSRRRPGYGQKSARLEGA